MPRKRPDKEIIWAVYDKGFKDGLRAYAWWGDGIEMIGTCGIALADALEDVVQTWNYDPPQGEEEEKQQ